MNRPLDGIRVVDFTHVLAGPACAHFLALLGADVIKLESVERGDAMRHRGGGDTARAAEGMSTAYLTQGGGKRAIAVDLEHADGRAIVHRLLGRADVFVENHRPTTLARLGLDEATTTSTWPRLVHCAMTGYGRGGTHADAPAYDVNIQAASGLMSLTGTADSGPMRTGAPVVDYATALAAGFAIAAALHGRERSGRGSFVDVSMLETAHVLMASTVTDWFATGEAPVARGNAANSRSPASGSFPCLEGVLSLGVNEQSQFEGLARALERRSWIDDARFATRAARRHHASALEAELADALLARTAADWESRLLAEGVPAARLRTLSESLAHEQVNARDFLHDHGDERGDGRTLRTTTLPFRIDGTRSSRTLAAPPRHGADTADVLTELGFEDDEIDRLSREGVVRAGTGDRR